MKLVKEEKPDGTLIYEHIVWGDHYYGCEKCREVDLDKPASFVAACPLGSRLINEELIKRQAPVVRENAQKVREWARKAGVFKGA